MKDETKKLEEKVKECQIDIEAKVREIERLRRECQGLTEGVERLQDENEVLNQKVGQ